MTQLDELSMEEIAALEFALTLMQRLVKTAKAGYKKWLNSDEK